MRKVLVVDDNPAVLVAFRTLFEVHELPCVLAANADEALAAVARGDIGVAVQDMNFSSGRTGGEEGIALFRCLRQADPQLPILLMTAWTSLERAVQLVKEGAADYLAKPWDDAKLVENLRRLLGRAQTPQASPENKASENKGMVFRSATMARLVQVAANVAAANVPLLITGPNGSGKELLANFVHAHSTRRQQSLLKVNVGALPVELVEAELFGAEAGAFTGSRTRRIGRFEAADGGTLFLDEIDSLPLAGQVKLLRALENGEFQRLGANTTRKADVRLISATNADLRQRIAEGRFREDLYFRINVVELALPPLRERLEDLEPLAAFFLAACAAARQAPAKQLADDAVAALHAYRWPGNIRELRNRLQRADLFAVGETIHAADLDLPSSSAVQGDRAAMTAAPQVPIEHPLSAAELSEKALLEAEIVAAEGVIARVAERLGISRQALYRRMARLGIVLERRPS